jgi:hypothetical protein
MSKIDLARKFTGKIFDHDSEKVLGLMIFVPFRAPTSSSGWRYASTIIPNPNMKDPDDGFDKLDSVQL